MAGPAPLSKRVQTLTPACWESNADKYLKLLEKSSILQKIPLLNHAELHNLLDCQLVRFRGMIQDMYDPEIYLEKFEVKNTVNGARSIKSGRFRDTNHCEVNEEFIEHSPRNVNSERQTLYCISVPATNSWVTDLEQSQCSVSSVPSKPQASALSKEKRTIEDTDESVQPSNSKSSLASEAKKMCSVSATYDSTSSPGSEAKSVCSGSSTDKRSQGQPFNLNLPLPDPQAKACIVKVYESRDANLCLNDVLEVVGFLSVDPQLSTFADDPLNLELTSDHHPPPSLVPRLHAVSVKKMAHCNPLVPHNYAASGKIFATAKTVRDELHLLLTQLLLGDELAADFLICHLLSTVYQRHDVISLGQLSLNILNMPPAEGYISDLYSFLELLLTNSHFIPMTLQNLNSTSFIPRKDYDMNRLASGVLQLSANTHLVLDETALQPGELNNTGVNNVAALKNVITQQRINYDFHFYELEYDTNLAVLVFSEGKSLLPCDVDLILEPDATCLATRTEIFQAARHYLTDAMLAKIRAYVTTMKLATCTMPEDVKQAIHVDFVELRKNEPSTCPADLHNLIVLSRLVSLSQGETAHNHVCWKHAKDMISRQKERRITKSMAELSMHGND